MRALDECRTFVVSRNGRPVGDLRPLRRHRFVTAAATVEMFRNAPGLDWKRIRRDLDEVIDQHLNPRG